MASRLPTAIRSRAAAGFTLLEIIISMTLLAILCTAVISAYLFMGRNLERLMNTQKQGVNSRRALQQFTVDVSSATTFTATSNATTSNLTLTVPVAATLSNCTTTNASATVTCTSTAALSAGLTISGTGIPTGATVSSITNATTFVLSPAATATNSGLTLSVYGKTGTITYIYNISNSSLSVPVQTFSRTDTAGVTTTIISNINTAATTPANGFAFYDVNGNAVASTGYVKEIEFAFTTTSGNATSGTQSSYVTVSPRVPLRNKALLK